MFLQVSVILLTRGCLPQCMLGYTPPGADTPREQTPWSRHPPEQTPPLAHPPGADPPEQTPPIADTPLGADTPQSRHTHPQQTPPRADTPPGSRHPPGADTPLGADTPREQTPLGAGRHPSGCRLQHTVYERPVRILLECILVFRYS